MKSVANDSTHHFRQIEAQISKYFFCSTAICPYGIPQSATYRYVHFGVRIDSIFELFLAHGYRRNGNCLYNMLCAECKECVPIRLNPDEFQPNRNQKRVLKKNQDVTVESSKLVFNEENLALCDRFLQARYPRGDASGANYYRGFFDNTICDTIEIRYRVAGKLIGVSIVDIGDSWLNAVYFYFDPAAATRSPGSFNILYLIEFCRRHRLRNLYLGYTIQAVRAMNYKTRFKPNYLYLNGEWHKKQ